MSTLTTTRSARELLVAWANQQDGWVRAVVGEALVSQRELPDEAIERATERFLVEKQLVEGNEPDIGLLGDAGGVEETGESLRLLWLRDCRGVNALAEGQVLEFNPRMTIVFGENATGKTGYVRVFKRVANVPLRRADHPRHSQSDREPIGSGRARVCARRQRSVS